MNLHLWKRCNIEMLWKEMKAGLKRVKDYDNDEQLFYATKLILNKIVNTLGINFKKKINTN
ncbi:MAG: hypothetical protein H7101_00780 [Deinococcales bacterium]|nr:hypothetical protein [Chitinophagaceae bacterium]